ncbi:MAG: hypothetical protein WKG01_17515 [Kofleriaceae bacterium]
MSFRDDHEAAVARVDALEAELERTKAECVRLAADNTRLDSEVADLRKRVPRPKPPKPAKPPPPERSTYEQLERRRKIKWRVAGWAGGAALFVAMIGGPAVVDCRNQRTHAAALAHYELEKARWHALIEFEDCAWKTLFSIGEFSGVDVSAYDPRSTTGSRMVSRIESCVTKLGALSFVPGLAPVKQALTDWQTAFVPVATINASLVDYYAERDWQDDNYRRGPALWAAFAQPLARFNVATHAALQTGAPGVRAEIRASQRALEARRGKDLAWWRIEVGYARTELASLPLLGGTQADVIAKAAAMRSLIAAAPLELRREWRSLADDLDYVEAGTKQPHSISAYQLWDRTRADGAGPIPERPVAAEGCGGGDGL